MDRRNVTSPIRFISHIAALALLGALTACGSSKPEPAALESLDAKSASARATIAWSTRVGEVQPTAALALAAGRAAVASADGDLVVLDAASGREAWRAQIQGNVSAATGFDGRYAAIVTDANELQVFDQGKLLWRERQPGRVLTAPVVAGSAAVRGIVSSQSSWAAAGFSSIRWMSPSGSSSRLLSKFSIASTVLIWEELTAQPR